MILDISGCPEHDKTVAAALDALDEFCVKKRILGKQGNCPIPGGQHQFLTPLWLVCVVVSGSYRVAQDRQQVARQRFNSVVETMRGGW